MDRLRRECPWEPSRPTSLGRYLLEEAYETIEAIETGDRTTAPARGARRPAAPGHVPRRDRRGARRAFDIDDVAAGIVAKLRPAQPARLRRRRRASAVRGAARGQRGLGADQGGGEGAGLASSTASRRAACSAPGGQGGRPGLRRAPGHAGRRHRERRPRASRLLALVVDGACALTSTRSRRSATRSAESTPPARRVSPARASRLAPPRGRDVPGLTPAVTPV